MQSKKFLVVLMCLTTFFLSCCFKENTETFFDEQVSIAVSKKYENFKINDIVYIDENDENIATFVVLETPSEGLTVCCVYMEENIPQLGTAAENITDNLICSYSTPGEYYKISFRLFENEEELPDDHVGVLPLTHNEQNYILCFYDLKAIPEEERLPYNTHGRYSTKTIKPTLTQNIFTIDEVEVLKVFSIKDNTGILDTYCVINIEGKGLCIGVFFNEEESRKIEVLFNNISSSANLTQVSDSHTITFIFSDTKSENTDFEIVYNDQVVYLQIAISK